MVSPNITGLQFGVDLGEEVIAYRPSDGRCTVNGCICAYSGHHPVHSPKGLCSRRSCIGVVYFTKIDYLNARIQGLL